MGEMQADFSLRQLTIKQAIALGRNLEAAAAAGAEADQDDADEAPLLPGVCFAGAPAHAVPAAAPAPAAVAPPPAGVFQPPPPPVMYGSSSAPAAPSASTWAFQPPTPPRRRWGSQSIATSGMEFSPGRDIEPMSDGSDEVAP